MNRSMQYIDGQWLASAGGQEKVQELINPATSEFVTSLCLGGRADTEAAVAAARKAFDTTGWRYNHRLRSDLLLRFANRLEARKDEIIDLLVTLNGKVRREAMGETMAAISELRYYAGLARNLFGRTVEINPGCFSSLDREPVGIAAIITPWNAPVTLLIRSLAPALAAGCTTVLKSAEQTGPVTNLVVECILDDEALPRGVINAVYGHEASVALVESPDVDVISFTGSTQTGKAIARTAANTMTRLSLELGGKAPAVVFPDCDIQRDARTIAAGALIQGGQQCTAIARVLVHDSIYPQFRDELIEVLKGWRVDFGTVPDAQMGSLIDIPNRDRIAGWVDRADREANLLLRGEILGGAHAKGAFIKPSLVEVEDLASPFIQEELFGPLLVLERFSTDEEGIHRANATRFGLGASVWTRDWTKARRAAQGIHSGTVWHNAHNRLFAEIETGGFRESGMGKLHGLEAMNDFMHTKHFYYELEGAMRGSMKPE